MSEISCVMRSLYKENQIGKSKKMSLLWLHEPNLTIILAGLKLIDIDRNCVARKESCGTVEDGCQRTITRYL